MQASYSYLRATPSLLSALVRGIILSLVWLGLSACSHLAEVDFPGIYKPELAQGNIFTDAQVELLQPGMTKAQVTYVMGTPLNKDIFQPDTWHYTYMLRKDGILLAEQQLTLVFVNDLVADIIYWL